MRKYIIRWKARLSGRGGYRRLTFRNMSLAAQCVRDVITLYNVRPDVTIKREPQRKRL